MAFCGTFLLLLPATAAMGATLPAMRARARRCARGRAVAVLYAANTFGAVLGVLGAAFWLVPQLGSRANGDRLRRAESALRRAGAASCSTAQRLQRAERCAALIARRASLLLAATGLLGIGYEVLVVRVLSQVAENTVYTFAICSRCISSARRSAPRSTAKLAARDDASLRTLLRACAAACSAR